jgi:hypothetical protein
LLQQKDSHNKSQKAQRNQLPFANLLPLYRNSSVARLTGRIAKWAVAGVLLAICLVSIPPVTQEINFLFRLNERDHGDSYILYDIQQFQKTGIIYRDLTQPPYLPVQYSPLVYILYSVPGRLVSWENPFLGPRLLVFAAFLCCVVAMASISQALLPIRLTWLWSVLAAGSIASIWNWVLQLRGDFPGIFFSLLSVRILLSRSRWSAVIAGICAGLATQFKITFVAAGVAGTLWQVVERRWRELGHFVAMGALCSVGFYVLYFFREPRMLPQIQALSPGVRNFTGDARLVFQAISEPVFLIALAGLPWLVLHVPSRWKLLFIFSTASFTLAGLGGVQAGGNINYYFEGLLSIVPFAVLGGLRLSKLGERKPPMGFFVAAVLGIFVLIPRAQSLYAQITEAGNSVALENETLRKVEGVLRGRRIFSTVPRIALLDPMPPLMEPYLLSYLHRLGKADTGLFAQPVRAGQYDVVATTPTAVSWRGIPFIDPDLHDAIASSYSPHCIIEGWLLHLPIQSSPRRTDLAQALANIGCVPVSPSNLPKW